MTIILICLGSIAGALLRYASSLAFNGILTMFPWGTLFVNLVGGFLMGIMMGLSLNSVAIPESIRLGIIVGFLGSLTTFSSFSGEVISLLLAHNYFKGMILITLHVAGSLMMTFIGIRLMAFVTRF